MLVTEIGLPIDYGTHGTNFLQVNLLISFILDYFDFYPTALGVMIVQIAQLPATSFLYGKEITANLAFQVVAGCVWQFVNIFFIHITIRMVGLTFV